ncbi:MAG: hypothetical protein AAF297_09810 [Planctomycetota bacterium]
MKNVIALVSLAGVAAAASAVPVNATIDRSGYEIYGATGISLDDGRQVRSQGIQYSNQTSDAEGFFNIQATQNINSATEVVNFDDYQSAASDDITLEEFSFVGGVNAGGTFGPGPGGVVFFDFFDLSGTAIDGFGVILPEGGNFFWTITLNTPFDIASSGLVQMSIDDEDLFGTGTTASTGQWFATADDATVGNNLLSAGFTSPLGADLNQAFEIFGTEVPTPGAMAVLGLAGLTATRRRR